MNITKYLKKHEAYVKEQLLKGNANWKKLKVFHAERIEFAQKERHMHLLVMLAFAVMLFITLGISVMYTKFEILLLLVLLLVLLIPYVFHYFFLENTVQRWYELADKIDKNITK